MSLKFPNTQIYDNYAPTIESTSNIIESDYKYVKNARLFNSTIQTKSTAWMQHYSVTKDAPQSPHYGAYNNTLLAWIFFQWDYRKDPPLCYRPNKERNFAGALTHEILFPGKLLEQGPLKASQTERTSKSTFPFNCQINLSLLSRWGYWNKGD